MGIAGSLGSGLLQFSQSETGGMVKRLHFGRAAEGGVLAANLAADGFDGPHDILEGEFGFLRVYCDEFDQTQLTLALGTTVLTEKIYMKRFACHGTTQHALQALEAIQTEHHIAADDIESIEVTATHELVERHGDVALTNIALAQYCLPFCIALACFRDARDPRSFDEGALEDRQIRDMVKRVSYVAVDGLVDPTTSEVTVMLKSGALLKRTVPETPYAPSLVADREQVYEKFSVLTRDLPRERLDEVFDRVQALERQADLGWCAV
jgi:2-methylcitrate dehydratase PrpD